jgi:hypothetical protein
MDLAATDEESTGTVGVDVVADDVVDAKVSGKNIPRSVDGCDTNENK